LFKIKFNAFIANPADLLIQPHPIGPNQPPTQAIGQSSTLSKENQQQQKLVTPIVNGVQNNDISLVVMGFGQQNHPQPPQNNITNQQFVQQPNSHQNLPVIQVNNAYVGSQQSPIPQFQQQPQQQQPQQQQIFNQYNTLMNQIPIHQSFMMPR
jgi:hypothetical protein